MNNMKGQPSPDLGGYRLLVVEDDYFVAQDLCATLREHGAIVFGPAPSIDSAWSLAKVLHPDCVLLDINLGGEHAFGLARELHDQGIRTVFTTGYDASFMPAQMHDTVCLQKPLGAGELLRTIRQWPPATIGIDPP